MNKAQQLLFKYVTQPIASIYNILNVKKYWELRKRREYIAEMNKKDFIETLAKNLIDTELQEKLNEGKVLNPLLAPIFISQKIDEAYEIFYEKKKKGYFDELNVLIKTDE